MKRKTLFSAVMVIVLLINIGLSLPGCTADSDKETLTPPVNSGSGHTLVYLEGNRILDVDKDGDFRIWIYNRNTTGENDPLEGPEVWGNWNTITSENQIECLGNNRVLVFDEDGNYKIWIYDRSITGEADPFTGPEVYGDWSTIGWNTSALSQNYHYLIYDGVTRVLDYERYSGEYRVWGYDRGLQGDDDPLCGPEAYGEWNTIKDNHYLYYLGGDRFLDLDKFGNYRTWIYDREIRGENDPLPGDSEVEGQWSSINPVDNQLVYLENDRVLDFNKATGKYRIWVYNRDARDDTDPFEGPEVSGNWISMTD